MVGKLKDDILFIRTVLDTVPMSIIIIDEQKAVFNLNDYLAEILNVSTEDVQGQVGGKVLGCVHLLKTDNHVCGKDELCKRCIINKAAISVFMKGVKYEGEGFISLIINGTVHNLKVLVNASPLTYEGKIYALITIDNMPTPFSQKANFNGMSTDSQFVGKHKDMKTLYDLISEAAHVEFPVLIQGESGTGKELVARAIHNQSRRREHPFIALNCATLPQYLFESELFGHVKGSFTGAYRDKKGRFEMADRGTVFLDEIGEMAPEVQVKLLRFLQEKTFEKVGGGATRHADVRIISATNKVLKDEVRNGLFRLDLFYRINVIPITIPPLRRRRSDIAILANHFIKKYDRSPEGEEVSISERTWKVLTAYEWPGNVRELQNVIKFSLMKCKGGQIEPENLPTEFTEKIASVVAGQRPSVSVKEKIDKRRIVDTLRATGGNKTAAAKKLNVSRMTLYRYIHKYFPSSPLHE